MSDWADEIAGIIHTDTIIRESAGDFSLTNRISKQLRKAKTDGEAVGELRGRVMGMREAAGIVAKVGERTKMSGGVYNHGCFEAAQELHIAADKLQTSAE